MMCTKRSVRIPLAFAAAGMSLVSVCLAASPSAEVPAASPQASARTLADYDKTILPMLEKHCFECHGDGYDKGQVAFDSLETDAQKLNPALWLKVLVNVRAGLMPADGNPHLSPAEQQKLEHWIKYQVFAIDPANPDPGRVTVRRLNRVEYRNTIKDLVGVDFKSEEEFPADDTGYGFDNIGDALSVSPILMEKYVAAAQTIVGDAIPLVPREPGEVVVAGTSLAGVEPIKGRLRLPFDGNTQVTGTLKSTQPGTYKVVFDVDVRGDFVFNPGVAKAAFRIDGADVLNREFAYYNERNFTFESTHKWGVGEHPLTISLDKLVDSDKKMKVSHLIVNKVTVIGPLEKDRWVATKNYNRYFPREIPKARTERLAYAKEILGQFASKAYRRPVTDDSADRLAMLAEYTYTQKGKTFEQGVAQAIAAVLASPRFLFRIEQPAVAAGKHVDVDEYSLASRLSYFLWSTMPDDELIALASRNELRKNLRPQVERMLQDERAVQFARNFTGQWLEVRDIHGISINSRVVQIRDAGAEDLWRQLRQAWRRGDEPEAKRLAGLVDEAVKKQGDVDLDGEMRDAMQKETELYFRHIVKSDRPIVEFLDSDYTFLNEKLAGLYGIPGVKGADLRLVTLPAGSQRGGVLTQGSTLVVTSNPDRTSPVKRGLFILHNVLGTPPPPPPANVPALEASEKPKDGLEPTLRESLELHRENPSCSSCHNRMDPLGLAFENFNALGQWRDTERKQPIDSLGKLITGEEFQSVAELKKILATGHKQDFYRTLADKMLTYATGRGTQYYDVETIDRIVARLEANDGKFSALLMGVIESVPFQKMRTQATAVATTGASTANTSK
jgi:mono/diheme cytochrome c family protein